MVTFEKLIDLVSLLFWCVLGLLLLDGEGWFFWLSLATIVSGLSALLLLLCVRRSGSLIFAIVERRLPPKLAGKVAAFRGAWEELVGFVHSAPRVYLGIAAFSVGLWAVHLAQIWLFAFAIGSELPVAAAFGLVPLAILVGLVPLTLAGIGSRDAALVFLLAPYLAKGQALILGFLCTMRYVVPALLGLPFFASHLASARATQSPDWGTAEATRRLRPRQAD